MFWLALWWALALLILARWRRPGVLMLWSGLAVLGGYAHAKQFKRLRRVLKRQRTVLGIIMREVRRKMVDLDPKHSAVIRLETVLERAQRLRTQQPKDKNKLYAMHAPEVECIAKGKAKQPFEFGVKTSIAVTHRSGLVVGARTFPGNPYDGHILSAQLEQTSILLEDTGKQPKQVFVDLGYRGVDADNPRVEIIHRGKTKSLTQEQRRWLKRRQAIEPVIGHLKSDHRMSRCWLKGAVGDAINAVLSAAGYNLRWLLRAVSAGTIKPFYFVQILWRLITGLLHSRDIAAQNEWNAVRHGGWCIGHQAGFMQLDVVR
jgi:IS5 family transposase